MIKSTTRLCQLCCKMLPHMVQRKTQMALTRQIYTASATKAKSLAPTGSHDNSAVQPEAPTNGRGSDTNSRTEDEEKELAANPYYAKYADKLALLHKSDPNTFSSRLHDLATERREEREAAQRLIDEEKSKMAASMSQTKQKKLESLMRVELLADKSAEEITEIWKEYHKGKDCVFAVIPVAEYQAIFSKSKEFPLFMYAVPREQGYEFYIQQFSQHDCHFTPLIAYQANGENAPSCLTLTHYTELQDDKGIVLMRGEVDQKILGLYEAQLLAMQVKTYYGLHSALKFNLVRLFTNSPDKFRPMDLIREFENYKKDVRDHKEGSV